MLGFHKKNQVTLVCIASDGCSSQSDTLDPSRVHLPELIWMMLTSLTLSASQSIHTALAEHPLHLKDLVVTATWCHLCHSFKKRNVRQASFCPDGTFFG